MTIQYQGVWSLQSAAQLQSTQRWVTDPLYKNTTLLLQADDAANGAQNNTFLDSSSNAFAITRNGGNPGMTQGSFTPFSAPPGAWSNYFGSNTSNLKFASNAVFAAGTGNFTVECFATFDAWASTNQRLFVQGSSGTDNLTIQRDSGANNLLVNIQGAQPISYAWFPVPGRWYHIALVRSGTGTGQLVLYIDGISVATGTSSASIAQNQVLIGGIDWASGYNHQGNISNLRYTVGAALYTANFTPPVTPLTTTSQGATASQVEILTCQDNRFIDNSSNSFSITVNGTTSVQAFSPFAPQFQWTPSVIGGSGYFDGTGDFLNATITPFGTGSFTIQCWVYFTASVASRGIFHVATSSALPSTVSGVALASDGGGGWTLYYNNGSQNATATLTAAQNTWIHLAVVKSGTTIRVYVNGVMNQSQTDTANYTNQVAVVGGFFSTAYLFPGYISGFRITNTADYSGTSTTTPNFTLPTAPPSPANSILCLNFTNAGIYDGTMKNNLETVGNAQVSTAVVKYGSGSMFFDGTGDYLIPNAATTDLYAFGSGDFTIEMWVNFAVVGSSGVYTLYDSRPNGTQGAYASIALDRSTAKIYYYVSSAIRITGSVTIVANTWYHVAICRSGTSTRLFVNGTQDGSTWTDTTTYLNPANRPVIAASGSSLGTEATNGYMDDLRITKGIARYTQNFIPPSVALPRQ